MLKAILLFLALIVMFAILIFLRTDDQTSQYLATDIGYDGCVRYLGKTFCDLIYNR